MLTSLSDNLLSLEHHTGFKNWADELRKLVTANIVLHLVLIKKWEQKLNDENLYPASLHRRILTSNVFL